MQKITRTGFFGASLAIAWGLGSLLLAIVQAALLPLLIPDDPESGTKALFFFLVLLLPFTLIYSAVPVAIFGIAAGALLNRMRPAGAGRTIGIALAFGLAPALVFAIVSATIGGWTLFATAAVASLVYAGLFGWLVSRRLGKLVPAVA